MRTALALFLLIPALALAAPRTLVQQGRLLDITGAPLNETVTLDISIYDAPSGGRPLFSESFGSAPVLGGY